MDKLITCTVYDRYYAGFVDRTFQPSKLFYTVYNTKFKNVEVHKMLKVVSRYTSVIRYVEIFHCFNDISPVFENRTPITAREKN